MTNLEALDLIARNCNIKDRNVEHAYNVLFDTILEYEKFKKIKLRAKQLEQFELIEVEE